MAYTKEQWKEYRKKYNKRPEVIARFKAYYEKNKVRMNQRSKDYEKKNAEAVSKRNREYYKVNKENQRQVRMKKRYGLTVEQFNALLAKQENRCAICRKHFAVITGDLKSNGLTKPVIDHDHSTGKVRGLLCQHCNSGLGMFDDSVSTIVNAGCYLENPPNGC